MALPTLTIDEVSAGIQDATTHPTVKKVLEGLLNDFMDLYYSKETPYTTGKQVLPLETTIEDVDKAAGDEGTEKKYRDVFKTISEVYKSGDLTPRTPNNKTWDEKLNPVLVLVTPNK